jgi:hypothetical protein
MRIFALLVLVLCSCSTPKQEAQSTGDAGEVLEGAGSGLAPEEPADLTASDMPTQPEAFTVSVSDGASLVFNQGTCQHYRGSTNFRMFWRDVDRSHTYVLSIEVMGIFDGAGVFDQDDGMVRLKLQEEAPRTGAPAYMSDTTLGDTTQVTIEYIDQDVAWGSSIVNGLHNLDTGSGVGITPATLPIWCADVEI